MSIATRSKSEEIGRKLSALYAPIAAELAEAEKVFSRELESRYPFVQNLVDHCADFRGKRLRPALVLLTAGACGRITPDHAVLAAVVEMVHTATLVHDDILDESMVRRHAATVNAEWGNETAVLMGDYLFTHAFHLAASLETTQACRWIGHATNLVCEGEMQQVNNRGNFDLDESAYFSIIRGKTAELTAVSCRLGAHYAGAPEATVRLVEEFGRELGVAFQIADDLLDLCGEEGATGKSLGTDLEKQKLTLPLIRLLATSPPDSAKMIRRLLANASFQDREKVRDLLEQSDALAYAWSQAERHASKASACLDILPESACKNVLKSLAAYVVHRSH